MYAQFFISKQVNAMKWVIGPKVILSLGGESRKEWCHSHPNLPQIFSKCFQNVKKIEGIGISALYFSTYFWSYLEFPTGWDSATFWDKGTGVSSLSWDKGTTGQAKNLAKGRDGPGQPKFGTGRDSQNPVRDAGQNGTEQKRTF